MTQDCINRAYVSWQCDTFKINNSLVYCINRAYVSWQCDTFKINNALVYQILLKMFMDQKKSMQNG